LKEKLFFSYGTQVLLDLETIGELGVTQPASQYWSRMVGIMILLPCPMGKSRDSLLGKSIWSFSRDQA
jgi:hypothetical protein